MKKLLIISGIAISFMLITISNSSAQDMNKLSFMVGDWVGNGWSMTRTGKVDSRVTEKVECKLDCNLLIVSGIGRKIDSLTLESKVIHEAFGVITYNKETGKYMIRAYKADHFVDTELIFLEEKLFQWSIPAPGGSVRFTVDFREPFIWKETGEFSRDGINWMKSMEMELRQVTY